MEKLEEEGKSSRFVGFTFLYIDRDNDEMWAKKNNEKIHNSQLLRWFFFRANWEFIQFTFVKDCVSWISTKKTNCFIYSSIPHNSMEKTSSEKPENDKREMFEW
jgi:hypothetical protein